MLDTLFYFSTGVGMGLLGFIGLAILAFALYLIFKIVDEAPIVIFFIFVFILGWIS